MFKKAFALLLAFMLTFSCFSALAAVKAADLVIDETDQGLGDVPVYVDMAAAVGDTVYMGTHEGKAYTWSLSTGEVGSLKSESDGRYFVGGKDRLYALDAYNGMLFPLAIEEDKLVADGRIELDWSIFPPIDSDMFYGVQTYAAFFSGNTLYVQTNDPATEDWEARRICAFDIETGKAEVLYSGKDILDFCAYKDGNLLALRFDWLRFHESGEDSAFMPRLMVFDTKTKAFTEALATLSDTTVGGLAYDAQKDTIYFATGGSIKSITGNTGVEQANYLPVSNVQQGMNAMLLSSTHYALFARNMLCIRSLDPKDKPTDVLKVAGTSFDWSGREGYLAFMKKYPEVPVISSAEQYFSTAEGILQDMRSDNAVDIYAVQRMDVLESLLNKDYYADLAATEAVSTTVGGMYPHMVSALYKNGELCALPYESSMPSLIGYSPTILNKIGLTEADLPSDFSAFLDFIVDWADIYGRDYPDLELVDHQFFAWRGWLIDLLFNQQAAYCSFKGIPITFDTPEFSALLKKVDAMTSVFAELDPSEETLNGDRYYSSEDPLTGLFDMEYNLFYRHISNEADYVPLKMNYIGDTPMLARILLNTLVVNPNSKNQETAKQFLSEMAANLNPIVKITLDPAYNEPVEDPYMVKNIASTLETIEQLETWLETIADEDKKMMETQIADNENWLLYAEKHKYHFSPEDIATYRAAAENIMPFDGGYAIVAEDGTLGALCERYKAQQLTTEQFISETEKVLKKMHSENR